MGLGKPLQNWQNYFLQIPQDQGNTRSGLRKTQGAWGAARACSSKLQDTEADCMPELRAEQRARDTEKCCSTGISIQQMS